MKSKISLIIAVVLAVTMVVTLSMVGCKAEVAETTAAETTAAVETTAAAETTAAETTAAEEMSEALQALQSVTDKWVAIFEKDGYYDPNFDPNDFASVKSPASAPKEIPSGQTITINWAQWAPADNLAELSKDFTAETGIKVIVEQTPWETFVSKYNVELIAGSDAWDIIVADSQDLGNMAVNGHFVEITDFIKEQKVLERFLPSAMYNYSEYPKGSGRYWNIPVEGDALGWSYRKDLFEDPDNMAAFEKEYGYPLRVPQSWDEILDIAKFFHDPDNNFYGVAIYGDNGYDSLAMFAMQTIRAYGGDLGNFETLEVDGYLNSPGAVKGLEYYRELFKYTPPGFGDAFFIHTNDAFVNGIVPMATNYFAFFPGLATAATNPHAGVTGYFTSPPQTTVDGELKQTTALGGQGASIVKYSKKQDLALKWLEWFARDDVQAKWGMMPGSFTCHKATLDSQAFLDAWPFNVNMKESFEIFEDWWAVPQYDEMLRIFSEELGSYVIAGKD
ncbi:MAG: extracellular solute-binding protein [Actinobacteria bacterium]|nr:extracellular solute-binding protein [Actinomycetota bacterium]MCG2788547.1 extracellular solute-binding protein [Actinomycetes bacterium]